MDRGISSVGAGQGQTSIFDTVNQKHADVKVSSWNSVDVSNLDFEVTPRISREKSSRSLSIKDRVVRKFHQLSLFSNRKPVSEKSWKPIDTTAVLSEITTHKPSEKFKETLAKYNTNIERLSALQNAKGNIKKNIEEFKAKNKDALNLIKDVRSGKTFKRDHKVKITMENGSIETRYLGSKSKAVNTQTANDLVAELLNREDFVAHLQNKHNLEALRDEVLKVKEELYQQKAEIKSELKSSQDAGIKELRATKKTHKAQIREQYKNDRELLLETHKETKQYIRDSTSTEIASKKNKLALARTKKDEVNADLNRAKQELADLTNPLKKLARSIGRKAAGTLEREAGMLPKKQERKNFETMHKGNLKLARGKRKLLKEETGKLKEGIKADKKEGQRREYELSTRVKGKTQAGELLKKVGVYSKSGIGEGGELGTLRAGKKQAIRNEQAFYNKSLAEASKEYNAERADFSQQLRGETLPRQAVISKLVNGDYKDDIDELELDLRALSHRDLNKIEDWINANLREKLDAPLVQNILKTLREVRNDPKASAEVPEEGVLGEVRNAPKASAEVPEEGVLGESGVAKLSSTESLEIDDFFMSLAKKSLLEGEWSKTLQNFNRNQLLDIGKKLDEWYDNDKLPNTFAENFELPTKEYVQLTDIIRTQLGSSSGDNKLDDDDTASVSSIDSGIGSVSTYTSLTKEEAEPVDQFLEKFGTGKRFDSTQLKSAINKFNQDQLLDLERQLNHYSDEGTFPRTKAVDLKPINNDELYEVLGLIQARKPNVGLW